MYPTLESTIQNVASLLLSVSQTVPVSQLSIVAWLMLGASKSIASRGSFNTSER
jgi:hypothetical protein